MAVQSSALRKVEHAGQGLCVTTLKFYANTLWDLHSKETK